MLTGENRKGACAKFITEWEKSCEYGILKRYPACCDKDKCVCKCVYFCEEKETIIQKLKQVAELSDFVNTKCTNGVTSADDGHNWRIDQCLGDRANTSNVTTG